LLVLGISGAQTLYNGVGHTPTSHQLQWYKAGLLKDCNSITPKLVINVNDFTGNDNDKLEAAIDSARSHVNSSEGMAIIYFPEGTYSLTYYPQLTYPDSNIVFQGDGSDKSILKFYCIAGNPNFNCFELCGANWSSPLTISSNISKTDSEIDLYSTGSLGQYSWIHFYKKVYDYGGEEEPEPEKIGQITKIVNDPTITTTIEIKDEANMTYDANFPNPSPLEVKSFDPIRNIGFEDITIERADKSLAADSYVYNIYINGAVNCWVRGVELYGAARNHASVSKSSHIEFSGCYFHEAAKYCGGGYGYGLTLYASTTNCLIENNIFRKLRHAMIAAAGSNCNVWAFNYSREQHWEFDGWPDDDPTDRDLDLHAKYPFGHLFECNMIEKIGSDDHHGMNGPYNAFVRNYVTSNEPVEIEHMTDWSTLGNVTDTNPLYAPEHDWEDLPVPSYPT